MYKPLLMSRMQAGVFCQPVDQTPCKRIDIDAPAVDAMTDLTITDAASIGPDATVEQANQAMVAARVRMLLVLGKERDIVGLLTARDTLGEKPVNVLHERGGRHDELRVADLMTPRELIDVLSMAEVEHAKIGHIVATLKEVGRQHALVVDRIPDTGAEYVRGIFSVTQIGRQLGVFIPIFEVAHTFAEIEKLLAA